MERIIKKISVKTVVGKVEVPAQDETKTILRVYGIATGIKQGESAYGLWTCLTGNFKAVNLLTGDAVRSGKAFLPDVALDLVVPALVDNDSVEFGFDISVIGDDSSAVKYVYAASLLIEATETDPIKMLENSIPKFTVPALENKPETKPEEKKEK